MLISPDATFDLQNRSAHNAVCLGSSGYGDSPRVAPKKLNAIFGRLQSDDKI